MNVESIKYLITTIQRSEGLFPGTSCVLTGSTARKELRLTQNKIQSDIDLLLIVDNRQSALNNRGALKELLQQVARKFPIEISCAITLRDHINLRRDAGFVRSAAAMPPIWDHIGVADILKTLKEHPPLQTSGALGQPVSYYCAKARNTGQPSDWAKARLAIERLVRFLSCQPVVAGDVQDQADPVTRSAIAALASSTNLWQSSVYFLASVGKVNDSILHNDVRERVFLENHGLEFQIAFVQGVK